MRGLIMRRLLQIFARVGFFSGDVMLVMYFDEIRSVDRKFGFGCKCFL